MQILIYNAQYGRNRCHGPIPAEAFIDLQRRLSVFSPRSRERRIVMQETAQLYGVSEATLYRALRQRSRPYLFSNTLAPSIASSALKVFEILGKSKEHLNRLKENTAYFRKRMKEEGFDIPDGVHPIVPVMLYDAKIANQMADMMLKKGIYVIGFSYPVVPNGKARIRTQISAAHTMENLDFAIEAFVECKKELGI